MSLWPALPWLWALRKPTLVLAGDEDHVVPLANARLIATVLPDARLEVLAGAGHLVLMDQAQEAAALIEAFLSPAFVAREPARSRSVVKLDSYRSARRAKARAV